MITLPGTETIEDFKKKATILIVDDNENNTYLLQRLLKQNQYTNVLQASDGLKALEILKNNKIDLMLLDVMMPNMDGYSVLENIKEQLLNGQVIVLMISAATEIDNIIKCIKMGAADFLPKPFNSELLKARISSCLERKWFIQQQDKFVEQIQLEKNHHEELLKSIFPLSVAKELIISNTIAPKKQNNVAILFVDLVGFTSYCDTHNIDEVFKIIQENVDICEVAAIKHNIQKIKTIGDGFMAVANIFEPIDNPVFACIECSKTIMEAISKIQPGSWKVRTGIGFGEVVSGIVGHRQYLFDVWGDAVNVAARVQGLAEPGTIYLSESAWNQINPNSKEGLIGKINVKGKGEINVYKYDL